MVSSCKDLIGTLWGLPKPHGNPTQALHKPFVFPSVCLGLAWVFDGSWWYLLLAGHSLRGSRPSIGLVSGAIITNLVFLESVPKGDYVRPHQAFFQFPGAIHGHSMGVWWGFGRGLAGVWWWFDGVEPKSGNGVGVWWGFGSGIWNRTRKLFAAAQIWE